MEPKKEQLEEANKTTAAVTVTDDYAVVVADNEGLLEFFKNGKNLENLYTIIEKKAKGLVADTSTKEGRSQIKTAARQIASVKTKVDDLGKQVVAELKALPKFIDANRKNLREKLEALQEEIRRPVTEIEERQKEIEEICSRHVNLAFAGSEELKAEIEKLEKLPLTEEKWHESLEEATTGITGEINALKVLLDAALKKEEDARKLEELKAKQAEADRIIREQKLKEEAERRAKEEAEARAAAERERHRQEMERAEREKAEAERRAAEAEKARQEAERKAKEAELATRNVPNPVQAVTPMSKTLPTPKPSKWTPEMKAINKSILDTFTATIEEEVQKVIAGFTPSGYMVAAENAAMALVSAITSGYRVAAENAAKALVSAIIKGNINNLKVEY